MYLPWPLLSSGSWSDSKKRKGMLLPTSFGRRKSGTGCHTMPSKLTQSKLKSNLTCTRVCCLRRKLVTLNKTTCKSPGSFPVGVSTRHMHPGGSSTIGKAPRRHNSAFHRLGFKYISAGQPLIKQGSVIPVTNPTCGASNAVCLKWHLRRNHQPLKIWGWLVNTMSECGGRP